MFTRRMLVSLREAETMVIYGCLSQQQMPSVDNDKTLRGQLGLAHVTTDLTHPPVTGQLASLPI